jgi:hypothetical protein
VVVGTLELLQAHGDVIDREKQVDHLVRAVAQARHVAGVLEDLVRGLPPEVREMLDQLGT